MICALLPVVTPGMEQVWRGWRRLRKQPLTRPMAHASDLAILLSANGALAQAIRAAH